MEKTGRKSPRRGRQKVGELKRRETKQCNFFLLFAFPKGDFFPEGNKLPFGDEKNKTGRKRSYKAMLYVISFFFLPKANKKKTKREEKVPFGEGKKKRDERNYIPFVFVSLLFSFFLLFSSSGRKKPKEEIKRR